MKSSRGISWRNSEACLRSHQRQQQHQRYAVSLQLLRSRLRDLRSQETYILVELLATARMLPPGEKLEDALKLRLPYKSGLEEASLARHHREDVTAIQFA